VELSLVEGALVVQPITKQPLSLEQLLRDVTDENLPGEWDAGRGVGEEGWGGGRENMFRREEMLSV